MSQLSSLAQGSEVLAHRRLLPFFLPPPFIAHQLQTGSDRPRPAPAGHSRPLLTCAPLRLPPLSGSTPFSRLYNLQQTRLPWPPVREALHTTFLVKETAAVHARLRLALPELLVVLGRLGAPKGQEERDALQWVAAIRADVRKMA